MTNKPIPLLWLCGPCGVGKSAVGWELFSRLSRNDTRIGYLDIDQLGMCYPAPASDPERHLIKARNLGALVKTFEAAGSQCVLVSGVVDETHGVRDYVDQISQADLTLCRLRADHDTLAERLANRNLEASQLEAMLSESDVLDRSDFADLCIDTGGMTVSDVVDYLGEQTGSWPAPTPSTAPSNSKEPRARFPKVEATPGSILWLCGTTGVGKSTVGWQIFEKVRRAGITAAFVDLEQIGFYRPIPGEDPDNHTIKAQNTAAMWQTFHASGAQCLIVVGPVNHPDAVQTYTDALSGTPLRLCRLHAELDALRDRILLRGQGVGPRIAGDGINGKSAAILQQIAEASAVNAEVLQNKGIGELCIDTDDRTVEAVVQMILAEVNGGIHALANPNGFEWKDGPGG